MWSQCILFWPSLLPRSWCSSGFTQDVTWLSDVRTAMTGGYNRDANSLFVPMPWHLLILSNISKLWVSSGLLLWPGVRVEPHMQELCVAESTGNPIVGKHALLPLLGSRSTVPNVLLDRNCPREPEDLNLGTAVIVCRLIHLKLVMQWFLLEKT